MSDQTEQLKAMLQALINDRQESAEAAIHQYIVDKTKSLADLAPADQNAGADE